MIEIPNYDIGRMAGKGGVAEVYLATHKLLDRTVAIKVISPATAGDLADKRFLKEARVVAGLRHPNIVSIYDVGVLENKYYIIMEYLDAGDLKQRIRDGMPAADSIGIMKQIGSALAHAHDKGFIHRDIKSQNIMFRSDGTAVLTDFGIVKDLRADTGYTVDGTSVGTPHYMSPEQAQGSNAIDWRTDLYSLGVTFYEMLTGAVPYCADSPVAVALKHIKDPVPKLPGHLSRCQPIIDRLMAKKPGDRFQSAHELVEALEELPVSEAPDTPTEVLEFRERSALRPNRSISGLKPVFLALSLAAAVLAAGLVLRGPLEGPVNSSIKALSRFLHTSSADQAAAPPAGETASTGPEDGKTAARPDDPAAGSAPDESKPAGGETPAIEPEPLRSLLARADYGAAMGHIAELRRNAPKARGRMLEKADELLVSEELGNAGDVYNAILSVEPDSRPALLGLLAVALRRQRNLAAASSPAPAEFESHLNFLAKAVDNTESIHFKQLRVNSLEQLYDAGRAQFEKGAYKAAAALCQVGLEQAPDRLRIRKLALLCRARMQFGKGHQTEPGADSAMAYYREVLSLDPDDPDARKGVSAVAEWFARQARSAHEAQNYEKALAYVEKARAIRPEDSGAQRLEWRIRGDWCYARGRYLAPEKKNARYYYRKLLAAAPEERRIGVQLARTEVLGALAAIGEEIRLSEDLPEFREAFQALKAGEAEYGPESMAGVREAVIGKVRAAVSSRHASREQIPEAFLNLVGSHFPDFDNIFQAQYEILVNQGDEAADLSQRAGLYLEALKLHPARPSAREKIAAVVRELDAAGNPEAVTVLKEAMEAAPEHGPFKKLLASVQMARDARAEIFTKLYQLKLREPFSARMEAYQSLFKQLDKVLESHGRQRMRDPLGEIRAQIRSDVENMKAEDRKIPEEFLKMASARFPELENFLSDAQYDILLRKAENADSLTEKAGYYVSALAVNPNRPAASEAVRDLARRADAGGDNAAAVSMLEQAMEAAPSDGMIAGLYEKIRHEIEIYPTVGGCGRENRISEMPVTAETLHVCLAYQNLEPGTIAHVALAREGGQAMEVPVVLEGRDGRQVIPVPAPVEGFSVGRYAITVLTNKEIRARSLIQFFPKRR